MMNFISELKEVCEQIETLEDRKRELSKPVLTDLSLIPVLYGWFKEILADMPLPPDPDSVMQRKKFLFVVMMLYSPTAFCGDMVKAGLRKELSTLFGITASGISRNISDTVFFYKNYRDYEDSVEGIYEEFMQRLKAVLM